MSHGLDRGHGRLDRDLESAESIASQECQPHVKMSDGAPTLMQQ
jgi:hypothetical protein